VNSLTDQHLLRDYTERRSEAAFAELVRRRVDFVYSAALRMVRDAHLAEDVTQGVFVALAQNARQLTGRPVLSGWLHRTAQNLAANAVRSDVRRRAREQEAAAMNELLAPNSDAVLEHIAPQLDAALGELSDAGRDALLLRYFERKSAREMAQTLGISDEAAQKRVSRAVERLREFFAKRGITVGASGLVVVISANAVQAAPAGIAAAICSAAVVAGTTAATVTTAISTKAIAMTTLQKAMVATVFAATVSTAIYEARQASVLRDQLKILQQQQAPLAARIQELTRDRDQTERQLALLNEENGRLNRNTSELLALRAEVIGLRSRAAIAATPEDPMQSAAKLLVERIKILQEKLDATPSAKIPELQLLTARDWADAAKGNLGTENDFRTAFSTLRDWAVRNFLQRMSAALHKYKETHNDDVPLDLSQLKPYFETPPSDEMLQRYQIVSSKVLPSFFAEGRGGQEWSVTLKEVIDGDNDALFELGRNGGVGSASYRDVTALKVLQPAMQAFMANAPTNAGGRVSFSPQQLLPYLNTPEEKAAYEKLTRSKSPDLK